LDRRKRDLKKWFVINKILATIVVGSKNRKVTLYKYAGVRKKVVDQGQISLKERAEVIHGAHGRCQMCGKSVEQHGVTLVVRIIDSPEVSLIEPCYWGLGRLALDASIRPASNFSKSALISVSAKAWQSE